MLIKTTHFLTLQTLKRMGFTFEKRSRGQLCLGVLTRKFKQEPHESKPSLVFLGGFGDTPLSWSHVFLLLSRKIRKEFSAIHMIDYPGFSGFLSKEKPAHSMDRLSEIVFDTLDTLSPGAIVGHSLGGWLAASYCSEVSDRAERTQITQIQIPTRLILVCPGGMVATKDKRRHWEDIFYGAIEGGFIKFRPHIFHRHPFWFKWIDRSFNSLFKKPEIREFFDSVQDSHLLTKKLQKIQSQTTLLWGENDSMIPSPWAHDWLAGLDPKRASCYFIEGVGHSPQIEAPYRLTMLIFHALMPLAMGRAALLPIKNIKTIQEARALS